MYDVRFMHSIQENMGSKVLTDVTMKSVYLLECDVVLSCVISDVWEERNASIFRAKKQATGSKQTLKLEAYVPLNIW
jgi:hypothetical protein